ncbi:hypothetical protein [Burkholderia sp. LMG 32019]|uniref:hypothetical protein n=1 Tax=Burkholderia sp. LMG 32019 TaxID=3158173 RepID=UPI003C2D57CE
MSESQKEVNVPHQKTAVTYWSNMIVSAIAVASSEYPYNHKVTLLNNDGSKFGDFLLDNSFGQANNVLAGLFVALSDAASIGVYGVVGETQGGLQLIFGLYLPGPNTQ